MNPFLAASVDEPTYCMGCNNVVYPQERPVTALKGSWHPGCLKCTTCKTTLSVRMLESYESKPYCRAHRPNPMSQGKSITERADIKQATGVPKASRREQGIDKTSRRTFAPGQLGPPTGAPRHGYVPAAPGGYSNARRVQGVNKAERMTFAPGQVHATQPSVRASDSQGFNQPADQSCESTPIPSSISYDQYNPDQSTESSGYDQSGYDQGGYEQGGYDQGGYEQGGYDQSGYDQGGYEQGGYDQGGYEQDQGGYEQGGYEQDQSGYDQGGYEQEGYEQEGYDQGYGEEYGAEGYGEEQYYEGYDQGEDQWQ